MTFTLKPHDMPAIFTFDLFSVALDPNTESVEDLMQRFQDSFRVPNTPTDMSHYQHVMHSSSTGRRRVPSHTRGRTKSHSETTVLFSEYYRPYKQVYLEHFHIPLNFTMQTGQCLLTSAASVLLVLWFWAYDV